MAHHNFVTHTITKNNLHNLVHNMVKFNRLIERKMLV